MRERGMIFNADMVRAVMNGSKTQTRRLIDWRRTTRATEIAERDDGSNWPWSEDCENGGDYWHSCPFGEVGDRLWVRETWNKYGGLLTYRADHDWINDMRQVSVCPAKWTPSIHMPRWASRITLEITGVRVERLRDVSDEDARSEGCPAQLPDNPEDKRQARTWFRGLWSEIYGEESWQANPWVWVIEFKRVEVNRA